MTNKLSLSKKGFDTENGRGPSPILEDGRMVSLPIPEPRAGVCAATYASLNHDDGTYADLIKSLGYGVSASAAAHLDPDLTSEVRNRKKDWRGMLGQVDQAESHLMNQGMGSGSLFLFWGWFNHLGDRESFCSGPGFSAFFGYLEVEYAVTVGSNEVPSFARNHPHFSQQYPRSQNRVYVARKTLSWDPGKPGWGVFKYNPRLRLSVDGASRSHWKLPGCFHPDTGCVLSYNTNRERWGEPNRMTDLQIPARGQEFVCSMTPDITSWVHELIDKTDVWSPSGSRLQHPTPRSGRRAEKRTPENNVLPLSTNIPTPLPDERLVSYGDRLLWHELGLQMNGHETHMLTEDEFVSAVLNFYPDATEQNVRRYRNYFNNKHSSMGFRDGTKMPTPLVFPDRE